MQLRKTHIATAVVGLAVVMGAAVTLIQNRGEQATVSADKPVGNARLQIGSQTLTVGQEGTIDVRLATGDDEAGGVDLVLAYDPTVLEVVDADSAQPGIQIQDGKTFEFVQQNIVNPTLGVIRFSAGQQPTSNGVTTSSATVASIRFKAKTAERSLLRFDFTAGALDDTNVIKHKDGRDLLVTVDEGIVTVTQ